MGWEKILFVILAIAMIWLLSRALRGNKEAFSKKNMGKSLQTLGFLALILIAVIALCVFMLGGGSTPVVPSAL